jgi:hypothetical protein
LQKITQPKKLLFQLGINSHFLSYFATLSAAPFSAVYRRVDNVSIIELEVCLHFDTIFLQKITQCDKHNNTIFLQKITQCDKLNYKVFLAENHTSTSSATTPRDKLNHKVFLQKSLNLKNYYSN